MAKKKAQAGGINKLDAVRQAMAELGNAATRTEIQKYVKEQTGVEINLDVVSAYKSSVAKESKKSAATTPETKPVATQPAAVRRWSKIIWRIGAAWIDWLRDSCNQTYCASGEVWRSRSDHG
jgi:ribosomal protein L19E